MSALLRRAFWPRYVLTETRSSVLRAYRHILRLTLLVEDPFVRTQVRRRAAGTFRRFAYVSDRQRVKALLNQANRNTGILKGSSDGQPKALRLVLDEAFTTWGVRENPMHKLLPRYQECDHKSVVWQLNQVKVPVVASFEDHDQQRKHSTLPFWELTRLLSRNGITTGRNGRKLIDNVPAGLRYDVLGQQLPLSRQRNILRRTYSQFLHDAPRPVHLEVLEHIERQISSSTGSRFLRRRLIECARDYYTVIDGKVWRIPLQKLLIP